MKPSTRWFVLQRQLVQELGREPTPEEIAERMELPVDKVKKVQKISKEPISLETPIGEEEDSSLGDFIEDKKIISPQDAVMSVTLSEQTRSVLSTLTPREEKVLRMRFGIGEKSDHTLEEVGQDFFVVTRERIRQIEAKGKKKYFNINDISDATRYLKLSRVSVSFSKGTPETYFICSGIVREDRTHEAKIVYKRLEDSEEGPISSNCDCHKWTAEGHCPHTAALFLSFHIHLAERNFDGTSEDRNILQFLSIIHLP